MKPQTRCLILVLYVVAVSGAGVSSVRGEPSRFLTVAPGIAHATFQVRPNDAEPFSGHAFKRDLDVAELRLIPAGGPSGRRTVEKIVAPYPAVVAINASFFDKEGQAMGLAVDEGRLMAGGKRQSWGALVVNDKKARIVLGGRTQRSSCELARCPGHPPLVVGGRPSS